MTFSAASAWAWILQRLTAVLLMVFLAIHMWIGHFADPSAKLTFLGSSVRLKGLLYVIVDWGLLSTGLYHGLNGLRNVLFDWGLSRAAARATTAVLWVIGVVWLLYGLWALTPFLAK